MRKKWWGAGLLAVAVASGIGTAGATQSATELEWADKPSSESRANTDTRTGKKEAAYGTLASDISVSPLLQQLSALPAFADWQNAQGLYVRDLYDPEGSLVARLWEVAAGDTASKTLGYLVTTPDGTQAYEFSRRTLPALPAVYAEQALPNSYIYAGPMLHLVYLKQMGRLELYNLLTGEILPYGELIGRVPLLLPKQPTEPSAPATERQIPFSENPEADALYAVGLYGQQQLAQKRGLSLRDFSAQETLPSKPAYVVYDAIDDKLYITLALTGTVESGGARYAELQDPFLPAEPVYATGQFDVDVFSL